MNKLQRPVYPDVERKALLELVPSTARTILDVGCNTGAFGYSIKNSRKAEVWGVEPDVPSARVAQERLDRVIIDNFHPGNPLPDKYFDLITFNDSLEHMPDPVMALELCKQKLLPRGKIQCCVPNMRFIDNLEHLIIDKDWCYEEQGIRDKTHLRFFTEKSVKKLFTDTGFHVVKTIGINADWWRKKKIIRRLLFRAFPGYTSDMRHFQIVVMAELP